MRQDERTEPDRAHLESAPTEVLGPGEGRREAIELAGLERYAGLVEIGRGGMGRVLRGVDRDLDRPVAIKILSEGATSGPLREKFLLEARIHANLEHPGIVPVHEVGCTPDGLDYFSMRLVRGETLAAVLGRSERPSWASLLPVFVKICEGVAYAHSRRVVHRDLKPSNVMVGEHGEVLVVDWGLARVLDVPEEPSERPTGVHRLADLVADRERTAAGTILGTPAFMAPEQAAGEIGSIDERTDVYGLGTILYQILTGRPPFTGDSAGAILGAVETGRFPLPSVVRSGLPRELDAVVARAMALRPVDRYPDVEALKADVEAFLEGRTLAAVDYGPLERAGRWLRAHRQAARVLGAALLAGLIVAGWAYRSRQAEARRRLAEAQAELRARTEIERGRRFLDEMERMRVLPPEDAVDLGPVAAQARTHFERALAEVPDHPEALHGIGRSRRLLGDDEGALEWFDRAIEVEPDWAPARADRIRIHLPLYLRELNRQRTLGQAFDEGLASWRLRTVEADGEVLGRLGSVVWERRFAEGILAIAAGRHAEALDAIEAYLERFPGDVDALVLAGRALLALGRSEEAVVRLRRAMALDALRPEIALTLAWAENACGRREAALAVCDGVLNSSPSADAFTTRALFRSAAGRREEAIEDLSSALALAPDHLGARLLRALTRWTLGDLAGVAADLEAGLADHPDAILLLVHRAKLRRQTGDRAGAEADIERVLEAHAEDARAHLQVAVYREEEADRERALRHLDRSLELDELPTARHQRGILRQAMGDPTGAEEHDRALAAHPNLAASCRSWALSREKDGDLAGAQAECDAILRRDPDDLEFLTVRSRIRNSRGDIDGAISDVERLLEVAPPDWPHRPSARRALDALRRNR